MDGVIHVKMLWICCTTCCTTCCPTNPQQIEVMEFELTSMRMDELVNDRVCGWRWIKYEEKVETGGRWSKPHVSTPSLHSLFDLRSAIQRGTCVLELDLDVGHGLLSETSGAEAERQTASLDHVAGKRSNNSIIIEGQLFRSFLGTSTSCSALV